MGEFEKKSAGVVLLLSVIAATISRGQSARVQPGVGVAFTFPTGQFHSTMYGYGFRVGWQGTAFAEVRLPVRPFGLRFEAMYSVNHANDKTNAELSLQNPGSAERIKVLGGAMDVSYTWRPVASTNDEYVLAGLGLYGVKVCINDLCPPETRVAWNAGAGIIHRLSRGSALFIEARYVKFASVNASAYTYGKVTFVPVTAGIRWGS